MELTTYVHQVQKHLSAAAALGDEQTRNTADALATAAEPAMRLAVLAALSAAADEITAALLDSPGAPAVSVRLDHVRRIGRRVALGRLGVAEMPVPDEFMGQRTRHTAQIAGDGPVLEYRQVPDLDDVPEIAGVGRGQRVRLVP